jgi:hypothetical protein
MTTSKRPPHWCRSLRWKDYELDSLSLERVAVAFTEKSEQWTCLKTAQTAGWDDELASAQGCDPSRSCYEEHPLLQISRRTLV